jgi:chorismate synthase
MSQVCSNRLLCVGHCAVNGLIACDSFLFCNQWSTFVKTAKNGRSSLLSLSTFGESHGPAMGGVLSGCPAGMVLDIEAINFELSRRKPGQSAIVTQRKEPDQVQFLSGIYQGKTTGGPIGFIIENANQKSGDYDHLKSVYRPSHADYTYEKKYGHRDHRGGGRASARETVSWVVAGANSWAGAIPLINAMGERFKTNRTMIK